MVTTIATQEVAARNAQEGDHSAIAFQPYHEMQNAHASQSDVLVQLRANLMQLEDLHARLKFMFAEVSYLLRKD